VTELIRMVIRLPRLRRVGAGDKERALMASGAYERLVQIYYHGGAKLSLVLAGLRSRRIAERAGPSGQLARSLANVAIVASLIPLHSIARAYLERAERIAEAERDLPSLLVVIERKGLYYLGIAQWAV